MRVKVLPLERWMELIGSEDFVDIMPKLERYTPPHKFPTTAGYYCATFNQWRTECWIQTNGQGTWRYSVEYFMYSLARFTASELNSRQIADLDARVKKKQATYRQRQTLQRVAEASNIRGATRETRKRLLRHAY